MAKNFFRITNQHGHIVFNFGEMKLSFNLLKFKLKYSNVIGNKIVFVDFNSNINDSKLKLIAEEIVKQNLSHEIIWLAKNPKEIENQLPTQIKLVKSNSKQALKELSTAKFWISNLKLNEYIKKGLKKKAEQVYFQTNLTELELIDITRNPKFTNSGTEDIEMVDFIIPDSFNMQKCLELIEKITPISSKKYNFNLTSYNYLKKYVYAIDTNNKTETQQKEYKHTIWQMWLQGEENAPDVVKKCFASVRKFHPEHNIIIVTQDNFKDYVDIPEFIIEKYKQKKIGNAHFSDIIRLFLLSKYGGTWIDSTCLLTAPIPDEILYSNVFFFKNEPWCDINEFPSEKLLTKFVENKNFEPVYPGPNFFISAKPNNSLINDVKNLLVEYWRYEDFARHYYFFHYFTTLSIMYNPVSAEDFSKMISIPQSKPHKLLVNLSNNYNKNLCEEIKNTCFIHKLSFKKLHKAKMNNNSFYNNLISDKF